MVRVSYRTSSGIYGPKDRPFPTIGSTTLADLEMQLRRSRRREHALRKCISVLLVAVAFCMCGLIAGLVATCKDEADIAELKDVSLFNESEKTAGTPLAPVQTEEDIFHFGENSSAENEPASFTISASESTILTTELTDIVSLSTDLEVFRDTEDTEATSVTAVPDETSDDLVTESGSTTTVSSHFNFSSTFSDQHSRAMPEFQQTTSLFLHEKHAESEKKRVTDFLATVAESKERNDEISNETEGLSNGTVTQSLHIFTYPPVNERATILETSTASLVDENDNDDDEEQFGLKRECC